MFSSLSKGICLLWGFSLLSTDPLPLSQRAPLPLKPIFIPFIRSPPLSALQGGLRVS